jgi:hypothetical protein
MMMNSDEYKAWLASRKSKNKKVKTVKTPKAKPVVVSEVPFLDWLLAQQERQDDVGRLARDVASERKRIGRPLDYLNDRTDLLWYCGMAPKSAGLSRALGVIAWSEWLNFVQKEEAAAIDSST